MFGARRPDAFHTQFNLPATISNTAQLSVISLGFFDQKSVYDVILSALQQKKPKMLQNRANSFPSPSIKFLSASTNGGGPLQNTSPSSSVVLWLSFTDQSGLARRILQKHW